MAIRIGKLDDSSLIARKLCAVRIVLAAAPEYLDRRGAPVAPEELADHECIIDTNFRDPFNWQFSGGNGAPALSVPVNGRLHFSNAEACLTAATAGLGISRLPSFIAGESLRRGLIRPVLPAREADALGLYAIYPPRVIWRLKCGPWWIFWWTVTRTSRNGIGAGR